MGSGSILLALWEREELDAHDWDSDPFVKNLPSQDPRPAPGGGEKLWLTPWGCRGPGQAGSAHLPAEGRAGLSSERLALNLAGPLRPPLIPGLEGPRCLGLPMSKCTAPLRALGTAPLPAPQLLYSHPQWKRCSRSRDPPQAR